MAAKASGALSSGPRSQEIDRTRARRRRANAVEGDGYKRVTVRLTASEYAAVAEAAEEASMTVPRYLSECALNPVGARVTKAGKVRPWLPWPKRQVIARLLMSAASAIDAMRLEQVAKIGSNINQLSRLANSIGAIDPELAERIDEELDEWHELSAKLTDDSARVRQLAEDVARR